MSNIEKALKKFQEESRKSDGEVEPEEGTMQRPDSQQQELPPDSLTMPFGREKDSHTGQSENTASAGSEIPAREEVEVPSQQSTSNDDAENSDLTEYILQSLENQEMAKDKNHIMSAIDKNENENNALINSLPEHDTHDQFTTDNEITPPTQETISDKHVAEDGIHSTTIDTFNVNERIVSYYCAIDKQTWKGPVMVHFKRLQLSLANLQKNNDCKVMLFTSSTQNEGKSTISTNTAIALCSDQKSRVAIVDCDFRKPSLNKLLGFAPERGLADYLAEKAGTEEITFNGLVPGLTIIPAGNKQTNVFELLDSDRMKEFLIYLKEHFDYVFIDTPPVLAFPDTAILAPLVDGVVFVINCRKSKKPIVKRAVETLQNCRIMGFVMNQSESAAVDYYGYTSGYAYYDYGSE